MPSGGVEKVNDFEAGLVTFEPATEGQKLLHAETLRAYSQMIEARRLRLDAVLTGLPGVLWFVIVTGAFVSFSSTFFFQTTTENSGGPARTLHRIDHFTQAVAGELGPVETLKV